MMKRCWFVLCLACLGLDLSARAAVFTVTTTNNLSPGPSELSLAQALAQAKAGDQINFNLAGTGPHYIATPSNGYPLVTNSNITIDGYSQPGAVPNSHPLLSNNVAKIQVVLDSRAGGATAMTFPLTSPTDDPGYGPADAALLGFVGATNVHVQGLSLLGVPGVGTNGTMILSLVSFAQGASGQIRGCWLGVDPDGVTVAAGAAGVTGLRYQGKDATGAVTNVVLVNNVVIGVSVHSTNAPAEFNVFAGMPVNPIILEGDNTRIAGNFLTVLPDGLHDYDVGLSSDLQGQFRGTIAIGHGGNNTLIGTDGDGFNDENERNVLGGMVPTILGGYDHLIEFYDPSPGTNIVLAGNYVGLGVDGKTRFTNGIPVLNAAGDNARYRIGSNMDNLGDSTEGNLFANNWPSSLFPASGFADISDSLSFFDQLSATAAVSFRRNSLIDNFPFPATPARDAGTFLANYYAQALQDPTAGVAPTLATNSTVPHLIGTVPVVDSTVYTATVIDLYLADPEGLTNGIAAALPELPQGFVQGLAYVGSFVENSAADKNSKPGAFDFDLSRLSLPSGSQITITANYSAPVGVVQSVGFTSFSVTADGLVLSWSGNATLQSTTSLDSEWTDESVTGNSVTVPLTEPAKFYRLQGGTVTSGPPAPPLTSPFSNVITIK